MQNMTAIIHNKGDNKCGEIAFYYQTDQYHAGNIIRSKYTRFVDGSQPKAMDDIICNSCGNKITHLSVSQPKEAKVVV